ncbi:MAG: MalY/PatB family protein [Marinifilaceae bacterium]
MKYNFDEINDRKNTHCVKYDRLEENFGSPDLLPLWVADMDFKTPECIVKAIQKRASHEIYGYTFRDTGCNRAIKNWLLQKHGWKIEEEWLSSSPGVVTALSISVMAFTNPGDRIAVQPPVYFPFFQVIKDNDRELIHNPLIREGNSYRMDFDHLEQLAQEGLKMLILCSPHNPVGRVWSHEELNRLAEICTKYDILVLADEIHSDLVFEEYKHIPFASISEDMAQRTITCIAPSKTFNVAGLASSAIIIPNKNLKLKYNQLLHNLHLNLGNLFGHEAMRAGYQEGGPWLKELMEYLKGNVELVRNFLKENLPNVKLIEPESTYLLWLDFNALEMDTDTLQDLMLTEGKVALNKGTTFGPGGEGFLRMNIACPRSIVQEALERIKKALDKK